MQCFHDFGGWSAGKGQMVKGSIQIDQEQGTELLLPLSLCRSLRITKLTLNYNFETKNKIKSNFHSSSVFCKWSDFHEDLSEAQSR